MTLGLILIYVSAIIYGIVASRRERDFEIQIALEKAVLFGASKTETTFEEEQETDHYLQIAILCIVITLSWTTDNI